MASRLAPGLRLLARRQAGRLLTPTVLPARPSISQSHHIVRPRYDLTRTFVTTSRRSNSSSSSSSQSHSQQTDDSKKSSYQRFKDLTKTYGSYAVLMYLALSAIDYSLSFAFVHAIGVERLEPYVDRMMHAYRVLRHGSEEADRIQAERNAEHAKAQAEAEAEAAEERRTGKKKEVAWYNNKQLWAEAALAYPIHKVLLLPVRAGLTVAWTPKVVNWLRARGWIGAAGTKRAAQEGADFMREQGKRAMDAAKKARGRD